MSQKGRTLALKIVLFFAALFFTLPLLIFMGQLRYLLILGAVLLVVLVAGFWSRMKTPSD